MQWKYNNVLPPGKNGAPSSNGLCPLEIKFDLCIRSILGHGTGQIVEMSQNCHGVYVLWHLNDWIILFIPFFTSSPVHVIKMKNPASLFKSPFSYPSTVNVAFSKRYIFKTTCFEYSKRRAWLSVWKRFRNSPFANTQKSEFSKENGSVPPCKQSVSFSQVF